MKKKLKNVKFRYEHFQNGKLMKAAIFVGKKVLGTHTNPPCFNVAGERVK